MVISGPIKILYSPKPQDKMLFFFHLRQIVRAIAKTSICIGLGLDVCSELCHVYMVGFF